MTPVETLRKYVTSLVDLNISLIKINPKRKLAPDFEKQDTDYKESLTTINNLPQITAHMIAITNLVETSIQINTQDGYTPQTTVLLNTWHLKNDNLLTEVETVYKIKLPKV